MQSFTVHSSLDGVELRCRRFAATTQTALDPVIMLHGTALSQSIWRGMGWIDPLLPAREVLTMDLRGHGRSGRPHEAAAYGMNRFVADVCDVLDAAQVSRAAVVGYSLGGRIMFSLAADHPARVSAMVSVAGSPQNSPGAFDRVFFPGIIETLRQGSMKLFVERWERHLGRPLSASTAMAMQANDPLALAAYMTAADQDRGVPTGALSEMRMPTLLLAGCADAERERAARLAAAHLPHARIRLLPGVTHSGILRSPTACQATADFLAR
ncbi:alpha/beta fold hydrolase [Pseudoclavibacter sp. 13-3]|uniref:alpha/beta fold hydrolase n=1 Tax=Pseudoclavibacter sp. 13-3 TaxID=2901228 RepID=UPI001E619DC3|nr:alpha/beta fold hydrolase [Pseudoclavibacter sp. 13-3]MCD7100664.1 alpha/beta hydrolase [Pseudoclavibacter sp. 13-3]